jgi:hypothetical protein
MRSETPTGLPLVVMGVLLLTAACGPSKVTISTAPDVEKYRFRTIAMMPFQEMATPLVVDPKEPDLQVPAGVVRSDISLAIPRTNERYEQPTGWVPPAAAPKIEQMVFGKLQRTGRVRIIPSSEVERALKAAATEVKGLPPTKAASLVAEKLSADAVLHGRVLAFEERVGSKLGASKPATVGFELKLIAPDGRVVWVANYYERQRPMIEDLAGFVQRGGVFVTAEELAEYGAEHLLDKFPWTSTPLP